MRKGDLVKINDGSYAQTIKNGELTELSVAENRNKTYVVVETGCSFPLTVWANDGGRNAAIVQELIGRGGFYGKVVFINHRFLVSALPCHIITIDGKSIEISHESYLNIKKQFQD